MLNRSTASARSAQEDAGNRPRGSAGVARGGAPWLVLAIVGAVFVTYAQAGRQAPAPPSQPTTGTRATAPASAPAAPARPVVRASVPAQPAISDDEQRAFLKQYLHGLPQRAGEGAGMDSARKLSVDALDPANVDKDAKKWELVVRKVRAGRCRRRHEAARPAGRSTR